MFPGLINTEGQQKKGFASIYENKGRPRQQNSLYAKFEKSSNLEGGDTKAVGLDDFLLQSPALFSLGKSPDSQRPSKMVQ